jgi:MSHA biogenesis protein MshJ
MCAWFAALKRREQILVAIAGMLVAYFTIDTLLISPARVREKRLQGEVAQARDDAAKLGAQLAVLEAQAARDPDARNRARLKELQDRQSKLQAAVRDQATQIVPADKMSAVLERMLARHPRLELVELRTLPQVRMDDGSAEQKAAEQKAAQQKAAENKPGESTSPAERSIYKHGVQLSVRGGYLELLEYLRSLESHPGRLYWELLDLSVEQYPAALMKVTLFTISFDSAWMKV